MGIRQHRLMEKRELVVSQKQRPSFVSQSQLLGYFYKLHKNPQ